jgi:hypothetical protein
MLKTVIRGAKIIFSVTLRVIVGRVGFIAHVRVIGVWGVHFHRPYGPQYLGNSSPQHYTRIFYMFVFVTHNEVNKRLD